MGRPGPHVDPDDATTAAEVPCEGPHDMTGPTALVAVWHPSVTDVVHLANVLYLCSYVVRDILWLRVLTVMAGLSLLPYYWFCSGDPLWAPIAWNALFTAVNLVQIARLVAERWPRALHGEQRELHERVFPDLTVGEFLRLVHAGTTRLVSRGERVVCRGEVVTAMMVLVRGAMAVKVDDRVIATLEPGQFVGEMSFISGDRASAEVVATADSRLLGWPQASLARLLDADAGLALKVRAVLGRDVVAKLRAHALPEIGGPVPATASGPGAA